MAHPIAKAVRKLKRWYSKSPDLGELRQRVAEREWLALEVKGHRILKRAPDQDEVLLLVVSSLQQNRPEEALKFALRALAGSATNAHPYFIAGFALKGMGRQGEACGYLRTAVALDPDNRASLRHLLDAAAAEFSIQCRHTGQPENFAVAPSSSVRGWALQTGHALLEAGEIEEIPLEVPGILGAPVPLE